jgi:hypothetical protein
MDVAGPDLILYVAVAVAPFAVDVAAAGEVIVNVLAVTTAGLDVSSNVSISNSFCRLACVTPPTSALTLEIVT